MPLWLLWRVKPCLCEIAAVVVVAAVDKASELDLDSGRLCFATGVVVAVDTVAVDGIAAAAVAGRSYSVGIAGLQLQV